MQNFTNSVERVNTQNFARSDSGVDLHRVLPRHIDVDGHLRNWARWVRVAIPRGKVQPMFRYYQSKARQWEAPNLQDQVNAIAAWEIEKVVSTLPPRFRTLARWAYAFPWVPLGKVRRVLGMTNPDIAQHLDTMRDMVSNLLRQKGML